MTAYTTGPWRWEDRSVEGKRVARLLVTDSRHVPCNDPVIFALREDWIGDLCEDREEAKRLIVSAPALHEELRKAHRALRKSGYNMERINNILDYISGFNKISEGV